MSDVDPREVLWGRRVPNDPDSRPRDHRARARRREKAAEAGTVRRMPGAVDTLPVVGMAATLGDRHMDLVAGFEGLLAGCGHEPDGGRCAVCRWLNSRCEGLACFPKTVSVLPVRLLRERSNRADWNAVIVDICGVPVGYVGAQWAARLAPELDAGARWEAGVARVRRRPGSQFPGLDIWLRRRTEASEPVEVRGMYASSPPEGCVCRLEAVRRNGIPVWVVDGCPVHLDDGDR